VVAVLSASHALAGEDTIRLNALADESLLFPREVAPRLHDFYVDPCRRAGFEPKHSDESARTRWMLATWDTTTEALVPQSVSGHLPTGAVAVPIGAPKDPLKMQLGLAQRESECGSRRVGRCRECRFRCIGSTVRRTSAREAASARGLPGWVDMFLGSCSSATA
jgi:hypothetical protein